ncbi:thioredoxin fold domain-containing protein [Thiomonas delicata]|uniref:Thioredoxin-like fold domain-containing protein n=1 Tax=Thiomonas delicata TaxID=364030 RepID=A0A238D586_THIDL|nr:thioredoxin fold domain-containing protein [Thiomonas delicata]SBP88467.1 conserved exported hypothetical protein [Thiomonas delicata]
MDVTIPTRRRMLRGMATLLAFCALPVIAPRAMAQDAAQAEGVLAQIGQATWIAEGHGKRVIYIFFDPNCPYCHKLYGKLRPYVGKDNLQFRWIPLGILTPSSLPKAAAILQAADPLKAFYKNEDDYDFANSGQPGGGIEPASTITPKVREELARNLAIYNGHKLFGVPAIVWRGPGGKASLLVGEPPQARLMNILGSAQ